MTSKSLNRQILSLVGFAMVGLAVMNPLVAQEPAGNTAIIPTPAGKQREPAGGEQAGGASPSPAPVNEWMETHKKFLEQAKKGNIDLLFIGDSITNRWKSAGKAVWAQRYAPLKAANFGIGGDKTQNVLWRIQNGEVDGIKPKVVVLMIGTNNTTKNTAAEIAEAIGVIVKELRQRLPESKILLLAIFPRGEKPNDRRLKITEINKTISGLADGKQVFYLDFSDKFLQPDGTISKEMMDDFLHIGPAGYQIWGEAMQDQLNVLLKP